MKWRTEPKQQFALDFGLGRRRLDCRIYDPKVRLAKLFVEVKPTRIFQRVD